MAGVTGYWLFGLLVAIPVSLTVMGLGMRYGLRGGSHSRNPAVGVVGDHDPVVIERLNSTKN